MYHIINLFDISSNTFFFTETTNHAFWYFIYLYLLQLSNNVFFFGKCILNSLIIQKKKQHNYTLQFLLSNFVFSVVLNFSNQKLKGTIHIYQRETDLKIVLKNDCQLTELIMKYSGMYC